MIKLLISLFCILILLFNYSRKQIVSSSSIWVFAYFLIMVVYPLYETNIYFPNESKIDFFALGGIIAFFEGLIFGNKFSFRITRNNKRPREIMYVPNYSVAKLCYFILLLLSFVALLYSLGTSGIRSILAGNLTSKQFSLGEKYNDSLYGFIVQLIVPCILALWISARTKKEKRFRLLALLMYVLESVLFGFTRIFVITVILIIFVYELRNVKQKKQILYAIIGVVGVIVMLVSLNFIRALGFGRITLLKDYFKLDYIFESTDFSASYYWLDKLLNYDPPYINPIFCFKALFVFIPRSIWPSKPEQLSYQILKIIDPARAAIGYSTAGNSVLGEGYAVLGYTGMILFPFIWGAACGMLDRRYFKRQREESEVSIKDVYYYIFAVFIVISGQRGDWSQYMYVVLYFYYIPLYLMSRFSIRINTKFESN